VEDRRYGRHGRANASRLVPHRLRAAVCGLHPVGIMVRGVRPLGGAHLDRIAITLYSEAE